jgi:hypothetical protein
MTQIYKQLFVLFLLSLTAGGNVLLGGSWRTTMSARSWKNREHRYFGWCHRFVDWMPWFGSGHCQGQYEREIKFGSVWAAWRVDFLAALAGRNK